MSQEKFPTNQSKKIFLAGNAGKIELITKSVDTQDKLANHYFVMCHPHPLYGGTMHNKVVTTCTKTMSDMGFNTVRFNYRGVENSEGEYAFGKGEAEDLTVVLDWINAINPDAKILLGGFSFGCFVAYQVVNDFPNIERLLTIAPSVEHGDFNSCNEPKVPWHIIHGTEDEIVPIKKVEAWIAKLTCQPTCRKIADASHFFHGKLIDLRDELRDTYSCFK